MDTNVAELCAVGKFNGHAKNAPWARSDGVLTEAQFGAGNQIVGKIARYAVANGFSRVLAPTRFVAGPIDPWFGVDLQNCSALRRALDSEGGKSIAIDFPLIIPNATLNDGPLRREIIARLNSTPVQSIWTRISGFGSDTTAVGLRKYISALQDFHCLGVPIIADGVGGLSARAIVAFGAASGVAYGVAAKERFDASEWYKPRKASSGGGGGGYSYLLPGVDKLLKREDAEAIVTAQGGRRLISCDDRSCCPRGFEDMMADPKGHFLRQRAVGYDTISLVSEPMRVTHYLNSDLAQADRKGRLIAKPKLSDEGLLGRLAENAKRLDRLRDVLGSLEKVGSSSTRAVEFPLKLVDQEAKRDRK